MNSRQRVLTSFHRQTPDRVPLDYLAVPELDALLTHTLDLPDRDALLERLNVDFRHLDKWGKILLRYVGPELPASDDGTFQDIRVCRRKKRRLQAWRPRPQCELRLPDRRPRGERHCPLRRLVHAVAERGQGITSPDYNQLDSENDMNTHIKSLPNTSPKSPARPYTRQGRPWNSPTGPGSRIPKER